MVLTPMTLTSNSCSTAALMSGLAARGSTSNVYWFCSSARVAFSVIRGLRITSARRAVKRSVISVNLLDGCKCLFAKHQCVGVEQIEDVELISSDQFHLLKVAHRAANHFRR